jgi:hypothetical protein
MNADKQEEACMGEIHTSTRVAVLAAGVFLCGARSADAAGRAGVSVVADARSAAELLKYAERPANLVHGLVRDAAARGKLRAELRAAGETGRIGSGINDRLMVRVGEQSDRPETLAADGESFTFVGHAFVRFGGDAVTVRGDLRDMTLRVGDARPNENTSQRCPSGRRERLARTLLKTETYGS